MLVVPNADGTYPDAKPGEEEPAPTAGTEEELESGSEEPEPPPEPKPDRTAQLEAQLQEEREARIRLEERVAAAKESAPAKEEPPKVYTRQELRAAVNEQLIDEDQMEEIWAKQVRAETRRELREELDERDRTRDAESFTDTEIAKYIAAHPEVKEVGSPTWKRVKEEYDFLIRVGDKDDRKTELKALRSALGGNAEKHPQRTAALREAANETSGQQQGGERPVDIWNQVPEKYRSYYKGRVNDGSMSLEQVKKDIPYMKRLAS
jgi:hypothetical protein